VEVLLHFGGFPDPLLAGSERDHRRWRREHRERVIREDLRDVDKREVDFEVVRCGKPEFAGE